MKLLISLVRVRGFTGSRFGGEIELLGLQKLEVGWCYCKDDLDYPAIGTELVAVRFGWDMDGTVRA